MRKLSPLSLWLMLHQFLRTNSAVYGHTGLHKTAHPSHSVLTLPVYAERGLQTVERPSVRPSLCPSVGQSHHSTAAAECEGFAAERPTVSRYCVQRRNAVRQQKMPTVSVWGSSSTSGGRLSPSPPALVASIVNLCCWPTTDYVDYRGTRLNRRLILQAIGNEVSPHAAARESLWSGDQITL